MDEAHVEVFDAVRVDGGGVQLGEDALYVGGDVVVLIGNLVQLVQVVDAFLVNLVAKFGFIAPLEEVFVQMVLQVGALPEFLVVLRCVEDDVQLFLRYRFLHAVYVNGIVDTLIRGLGRHLEDAADDDGSAFRYVLVLFCQFAFDGNGTAHVFILRKSRCEDECHQKEESYQSFHAYWVYLLRCKSRECFSPCFVNFPICR